MKLSKTNKIIIGLFLIVLLILIVLLGLYYYFDSIKHIGLWKHQLIVTNDSSNVVKDNFIEINLMEDNTFTYEIIDNLNSSNNTELYGKYVRNNEQIKLMFFNASEDMMMNNTLYLNGDKLCFYEDNQNKYLLKDEISVLNIPEIYKEITYKDYLDLLKNKEKAIVVVGSNTCYYCILYKETLIDVYSKYKKDFYFVDSNGNRDNFNLSGTPTTYLLENGEVVDTIIGYRQYNDIIKKLDSNNY